ncbi:MAG: 4-alpha-glucanotransferase [Gammaproteobacteria bacterium]|nr:4-alpha-glucanotransferase [Gammaproteobacteria bacterium]
MTIDAKPDKRSAWPDKPCAGVCLHLTSLPGPYGIGELGAAAFDFIDTLAKMRLQVWQILPAGPTGFGDSPYQPLSDRAGNEMLIDVAALVDDGLLEPDDLDTLRELPVDTVDFAALLPRKTAILGLAASRFSGRASAALKLAYQDFIEAHDARWLRDYARFRALKDCNGQKSWTTWSSPVRDRDPAAMRRFEKAARQAIENVRICQFLYYRQWRKLRAYARKQGVQLFGDLPIYVAPDSVDAWTSRELLHMNDDGTPRLVAGVPPDYFSADGQLWGNPVYNWPAHAENGFQWWLDRLRHALAQTDLLRIDHFRGFESYWAVPGAATSARDGEWLPGPGNALFDAIRDALGLDSIVAEDLGLITAEVETLRRQHGLPGMKVLQFELAREDFNLADIKADCVCYTATHDSDTTRGWLNGSPGDTRKRSEIRTTKKRALQFTAGTAKSIHRDLIRLAFSSEARLAIAPMQDYLGLGSSARLNKPGNPENNWRWRMRDDHMDDVLIADIANCVSLAGRSC